MYCPEKTPVQVPEVKQQPQQWFASILERKEENSSLRGGFHAGDTWARLRDPCTVSEWTCTAFSFDFSPLKHTLTTTAGFCEVVEPISRWTWKYSFLITHLSFDIVNEATTHLLGARIYFHNEMIQPISFSFPWGFFKVLIQGKLLKK